ncbi:MAG TPA: DUF302 domain-containing protein [Rectinemataceae bacterium]|nr:DUF302 domain-containing protein [Rectinemataceae bacterium]
MAYNNSRKLSLKWEDAIAAVKAGLKAQGFGVLTEIDMQTTLREKVGAEIGRYVILGACNPGFANKAIALEGRIGVLLPCNILVRELGDATIEVVAVNPAETMKAVANPALESLAGDVADRLGKMLAGLG